MTALVEEAGERLRHAVETGSYTEAQGRLSDYAREVNAALAAAGPNDLHAAETLGSVLKLLRWADRAVRAGRAHAAGHLARVAAARPYRPTPPSPSATFRLEG